MTNPRKSPRTIRWTALAAFSFASFGSLAAASAHPDHSEPVPPPASAGHYQDDHARPGDYDLDDDGILEHVEIDYRHYDRNRDGVLGPAERTAYWTHMFDMGKFGVGFSQADKVRLARIANFFDRDGDGRLTDVERVAISRLIGARKMFTELDRNRDNNVTRREAGMIIYRGGYDGGFGGFGGGFGDDHYGDDRYIGDGGFGFFSWYGYGGHGGGYDRPRPVSSRNWIVRSFETLDRNDNGKVSWNEVESHLIVSFRRGVQP
jgi:hypothetical protein